MRSVVLESHGARVLVRAPKPVLADVVDAASSVATIGSDGSADAELTARDVAVTAVGRSQERRRQLLWLTTSPDSSSITSTSCSRSMHAMSCSSMPGSSGGAVGS